jgi:hypothetical protein
MSRRIKWLLVLAVVGATVGASIVFSRVCWFKQNEHVALWLEGIALVAIFVWDRIDHQDTHKETLAQLEIAKQQSQLSINSERAWLTAGLRFSSTGRIYQRLSSGSSSSQPPTAIDASFVLELINNGRTPAWVELVSASMEISGKQRQPEGFIPQYVPPLAAGQTHEMEFMLHSDQPQGNENLNVHIKIHYRDIFESRDMLLEFSVDPRNYGIQRLEQVKVNFVRET